MPVICLGYLHSRRYADNELVFAVLENLRLSACRAGKKKILAGSGVYNACNGFLYRIPCFSSLTCSQFLCDKCVSPYDINYAKAVIIQETVGLSESSYITKSVHGNLSTVVSYIH